MLEWTPHKCEGVESSNKHSKKFSETRGNYSSVSRQFGKLCLPQQRGWKTTPLQFHDERFLEMVHGKTTSHPSRINPFGGRSSGLLVQSPPGQGRLHHGQKFVPVFEGKNVPFHRPTSGYVCQPWKPPVGKICFKIPPLGGHNVRRPKLLSENLSANLCKPPLVSNSAVAKQIMGEPPPNMFNDNSLLGWSTMVAPVSKTAFPPHSSFFNSPLSRNVQKLPREIYEGAKMAPSLHCAIRKALEGKQVSSEDIDSFLKQNKTWLRYDSAFKLLCSTCKHRGVNPEIATLQQMASQILFLNKFSPAQARNAYSGMLLIPGWDQLRFCAMLNPCKRSWNHTQPKYADFWDARNLLNKLALRPLNFNSISQVRDRFILCARLFHLSRNIDLERSWRCLSQSGAKKFILTQRKGQKTPSWEQLIEVANTDLSPWHLAKRYVELTAGCVAEGGPLLLSLVPPFKPLTANTIGSLTRKLLADLGVPTKIWGPHSTRGAGVQLYKYLGLNSEEVCEIGKWKNTAAFSSHYLRLDAALKAGEKLSALVHNVSPSRSAEPDQSRTPGNFYDLGGSDWEGEAQRLGEPTLPPILERPSVFKNCPSLKRSLSASSGTQGPTKFHFKHTTRSTPTASSQAIRTAEEEGRKNMETLFAGEE